MRDKKNFLYFLLFSYLFFNKIQSGIIYPDAPDPIVPYRNNINEVGSFKFFLRIQTKITVEPTIQIAFPQVFPQILVDAASCAVSDVPAPTPPCKVKVIQSSQTIEMDCYCNSATKIIEIPLKSSSTKLTKLDSGSTIIELLNVKNPGIPSFGTGNFQIKTFSTGQSVDINGNFGTIGISPALIPHNITDPAKATIANDGSSKGGVVTNYLLTFTTTKYLSVNSWFRFKFPSEFTKFGTISCQLTNLAITLTCSLDGNVLMIKGLTKEINIGQNSLKLLGVYNPFNDGTTANFTFETLRPGTNTVVEYYEVIGINIKPGKIYNPKITAYPLNQNLRVDYTISFTPQNSVEENGKFIITFPGQYNANPLDSTCRVIQGLEASSIGPISCTTSGKVVTITNFAAFSPQFIEFKVFAVNPGSSGTTDHFTIVSQTPSSKIIDQNLQAGQLSLSSVDKPNFLQVDLYRKLVNLTLDQIGPIDFRLYPKAGNTLPITTVSSGVGQGEIIFQLPLWWKNTNFNNGLEIVGDPVLCKFGLKKASSCDYGGKDGIQIYKIRTPVSAINPSYAPIYATNKIGLGQCDVPISIEKVHVTPIPGRFDFRVLTLKDTTYTDFNTQPLEQDVFTMDIPVPEFPKTPTPPSVYSTSKDKGDIDNQLVATFSVGLTLPWEGAVNLNFTSEQLIYENSAKWDSKLGYLITGDFRIIPCTVEIDGKYEGYAGTDHPSVRCFAFKALASTKTSVIQVRGFSKNLVTGTVLRIIIPNVKFCLNENMNCNTQLTTSYTTSIEDPYTLNKHDQTLAYTTVAGTLDTFESSKPTFGTLKEICETATWTFSFNLGVNLNIGDHILLKFPADRFYFKRTAATSDSGTVDIIYHEVPVAERVVNVKFNELYYLIRLNKVITASASASFNLGNIRNAFKHTPGIDVKMIYWAGQKKIGKFTFSTSDLFDDGGILNQNMQLDPAGRSTEFDSWINHRVDFTICNPVDKTGAITIEFPTTPANFYSQFSSDCQVLEGITAPATKTATTLYCKREGTGIGERFMIKNFDRIPELTDIKIVFKIFSKMTATAPTNYRVHSWYNPAGTLVNLDANENDFELNVNAVPIAGTRIFPNKLVVEKLIQPLRRARKGDRGPFYMHVTTANNIPTYSANSGYQLITRFPYALSGISNTAVLECRVDGYLSRSCTDSITGGFLVITMKMAPNRGITAGVPALIMLSTRNIDNSATGDDGILWKDAGIFEFEVAITGGTTESTKKRLEVYPRALNNFWAWSSNKLRSTTSVVTDTSKDCSYDLSTGEQCGFTYLKVFFETTAVAEAYDHATQPSKLFVEFERSLLPLFENGFLRDLGTGLNHRNEIPCLIKTGLTAQTNDRLRCILYLGTWPNPTRIQVSGYSQIAIGTAVEIHFPKIFNPNSTIELVKVRVRFQELIGGEIKPLMEQSYDLVNVTFQLPTPDVTKVNKETLTKGYIGDAQFDQTNIDTDAELTIQWASKSHQMGGSDYVLFQFPKFWQIYEKCVCGGYTNVDTDCDGIKSAYMVGLKLTGTVAKGSVSSPGTIKMKTPPFKYLNPATVEPIKCYVFSRQKLLDIYTYPQFSQVLNEIPIVTFKITTSDTNKGSIGEYTIEATIPRETPIGGIIRITVPNDYDRQDADCKNDAVGGSKLKDDGFICNRVGTTNVFLIKLSKFALPIDEVMKVKTRLKNPASDSSNKFIIETFYEDEAILNKLVTKKDNIDPPALTDPTAPDPYWNRQYRTFKFAHINDRAPVEIIIQLGTTIAKGAPSLSYLEIDVPAGFSLPKSNQIFATFENTVTLEVSAAYKTIWVVGTPNKIQVYAPEYVPLESTTKYILKLETLNSPDGIYGLQYPSTSGTYTFTIKTFTTVGPTLTEFGSFNVFVPGVSFNKMSTKSIIVNGGYKNLMFVYLDPATTIPQIGGSINVFFPTVHFDGVTPLFEDDLGTGDKGISCAKFSNIVGTLSCTLHRGSHSTGVPAVVTVTGWTADLVSGTLYSFFIDGFKNPPGGDMKTIVTRVESYNAGVLINGGIHYDFTCIDLAAATDTMPAPTSAETNPGGTGATIDLKIKSPEALKATHMNDFHIIEYPEPVFPKIPTSINCLTVANTECFPAVGNNWVVFQPKTTNIPANSATTWKHINANQAKYDVAAGIQIIGYAISRRILKTVYTYGGYNLAVVSSTSLGFAITSYINDATRIPANTYVKLLFTIDIPSGGSSVDVSENGTIDIAFPSGFTLESFCDNEHTSELIPISSTSFSCISTDLTRTYSIKGFKKIEKGKKVVLSAYVLTPSSATTTPTVTINIYADVARTTKMYSKTDSTAPSVVAQTGFKNIFFGNFEFKNPFIARANSVANFRLFLTIGTTLFGNGLIRFKFATSTGVTLPTGGHLICSFQDNLDRYESRYCVEKSPAEPGFSLVVQMKIPHDPSLGANIQYLIQISSSCGDKNMNGLLFPNAGRQNVVIEVSSDGTNTFQTTNMDFMVSAPDFTSSKILWLWNNQNSPTHFVINFQPSNLVPSAGKILIGFPLKNRANTATFFSQNLGLSSMKKCYSTRKSDLIPTSGEIICKLVFSGDRTYIEITGFQDIGTSKIAEIIISDILNPNIGTDDASVDIELRTEDASGTILNQKLIFDVIAPQASPSIVTGSISLSQSTNNIQDSGAQWTFTNIVLIPSKLTKLGKIIIVFPESYSFSKPPALALAGTSPAGTLDSFHHIVTYSPSTTIGGSAITLKFVSGMPSASAVDSRPVKIYIVYDRIYVSELTSTVTYDPAPTAITLSSFTQSNNIAGLIADYSIKLTLTKNIPPDGALQLIFPVATWNFKNVLVYSGLKKKLTSITFPVANIVQISLGSEYKIINGIIEIIVTLLNPAAATYANFEFKIYNDNNPASLLIAQSATTSIITVAHAAGYVQSSKCTAYFHSSDNKDSLGNLKIEHEKNAGTTWTATDTNIILFTSFTFSATPAILMNTISAGSGIFSSSSTETKITRTTTQQLLNSNIFEFSGIVAPTASKISSMVLQIDDGTSKEECLINQVNIRGNLITGATLEVGTRDQNMQNYVKISFSLTAPAYSSGDNGFLLEFSDNFASDLGFGLVTDSYIPCYSPSHANLLCTLKLSEPQVSLRPKIIISNYGSMAGAHEIWIYRFQNPSSIGTASLSFSYYEHLYGNYHKLTNSITYEMVIVNSAPIDTSSTILFNPLFFQSTETNSVTIKMNNIPQLVDAGGHIYYFISGQNMFLKYKVAAPIPTISLGTCVWHAIGKMIYCPSVSATADITFTISNFENPSHKETTESGIYGYAVNSDRTLIKRQFFKNTYAKSISTNGVAYILGSPSTGPTDYYFSVDLNGGIPRKGCLRIQLVSFTSPTVTKMKMGSIGNYDGTVLATINGNYLYLHGFNMVYKGTFSFSATLTGGKLFGSSIINYDTFADYSASPIQEIEGLAGTVLTFTSNKPKGNIAGFFVIDYSATALQNVRGPLVLNFNPTANLVQNTEYLKIIKPATFSFASYTTQLRCKFTLLSESLTKSYTSERCYIDDSEKFIMVGTPKTASIQGNKLWELSIFFSESNDYGFLYPAAGQHKFNVDLHTTETSGVIKELNDIFLNVHIAKAGLWCVRSMVSDSSIANLLNIKFKTTNAVSDRIDVLLSTTDIFSKDLYYFNLGYEYTIFHHQVYSGNEIPFKPISGLTPSGTAIICQVFFGSSSYIQRTVNIRISGFNAIGANSVVEFNIKNILNPLNRHKWTWAIVQSFDWSSNLMEFKDVAFFPFVTYTSNPFNFDKGTVNFPTIAPLDVESTNSFTINSQAITETLTYYDGFMLEFESDFYKDDSITANIGGVAMGVFEMTNTKVFFKLEKANPLPMKTGIISIVVANMKNPSIKGPYTQKWKLFTIYSKEIKYYVTFINNQPSFTAGSFVMPILPEQAIKIPSTPAGQNPVEVAKSTSSYYIATFTLVHSISAGNTIKWEFPAGFTGFSASCGITSGYAGKYTCIQTGNYFAITFNGAVSSGTKLVFQSTATSPSAVGATAFFKLETFVTNVLTSGNLKAEFLTVPGVLVKSHGAYPYLYSGIQYLKKTFVHLKEYGNFELTLKSPGSLTKGVDYVKITEASGLFTAWTSILNSGEPYDDMSCFWGLLGAMDCTLLPDGIQVWAPTSTDINTNDIYKIKVYTNRLITSGVKPQEEFEYPDAKIYDVSVSLFSGASNTQKSTMLKKLNVFKEDFKSSHIVNLITTKDHYSLFELYFTLTKVVNSEANANFGQILLYFPTHDGTNKNIFLNDIGTGFNNGQYIDCICVNGCSDPKCKINTGSSHIDSPAVILIQSTGNFPANTPIKIKIPKMKNPSIDWNIARMKIIARNYDSGTKTFTNLNEQLEDFTFYATTSTPSFSTIGFKPSFNLNKVGQEDTIAFIFTNSAGELTISSNDRFILETTTPGMEMREPRPTPFVTQKTTVTGNDVNIYPLSKWMELTPTVNHALGSTTLTFTNFKNMPYQLPTGIDFKMHIWVDGNVKEIISFARTDIADPHALVSKAFKPSVAVSVLQPQVIELKFKPYNLIPKTGLIEIQIPNCGSACDWKFIDTYCYVQAGLYDSTCDIDQTSLLIKMQSFSRDYDPKVDPEIIVYFNTQNPSTTAAPGVKFFTVTSYWSSGTKELIDQDLNFDNRYSLTNPNILIVVYYDMLVKDQEMCGGKVGPVNILFNLRNTLTYPGNDYIIFDPKGTFFLPPDVNNQDELICYFTKISNLKFQKIKSHRCDQVGALIHIYVPEEMDITQNLEYKLTLMKKFPFGIRARNPSGIHWVYLTTSKNPGTNDAGWFEARIPPCLFRSNSNGMTFIGSNDFYVVSHNSEASKSTSDYTHNLITMNLASQDNIILEGDPKTVSHTRILVEFPTHNELDFTYPIDLGFNFGAATRVEMGCNGYFHQAGVQLQPKASLSSIKCECVKGTNGGTNSTNDAAVVFIYNYNQVDAQTQFNLHISQFANPLFSGVTTHLIVRVQSKQNDGSYYDIYYHPVYHIIRTVFSSPNSGSGWNSVTANGGEIAITRQNNYVAQMSESTTFRMTGLGVLPMNSIAIVVYDVPYTTPNKLECSQNGDNGVCGGSPFNNTSFFINRVGSNLPFVYIESNNYVNPPMEWKTTSRVPKSNTYTHIFKNKRYTNKLTLFKQSPDKRDIYVVLQTPINTNPVNLKVKYKIGVFFTTLTTAFSFLELFSPIKNNHFPLIDNPCIVNRGFVLKDVLNPDDKIICQVSTAYGNSSYRIDVFNFGKYNGDGWIILEVFMTNPATPMWTGPWKASMYDNYGDLTANPAVDRTRIIDQLADAGGRTWVGIKPFPNLFRVFRNVETFEERRAKKNEYAEIHMRMIPKVVIPVTKEGGTEGRVEIWMPNEYEIPNGGTKICEIGHNYQTNTVGQKCEITSDKKIIIYTNDTQNLPTACSNVKVTTEGALGGDGVRLPSSPGGNDFEIYEYSGKTLVEYSKPGVLTKPEPSANFQITSTVLMASRKTVIRVKFVTPLIIPAGYDTSPTISDPLKKNPIGNILVTFNTWDIFVNGFVGFPLKLGLATAAAPYLVSCKMIKGIIPKVGEDVKCELTPSPSAHILNPVIVKVTNFQEIAAGSEVEIHLADVLNSMSENNNGLVDVSTQEILGDSTLVKIMEASKGFVKVAAATVTTRTDLPLTQLVMNPSTNYVGEILILDFKFAQNNNLKAGDHYVFRFPPQFELKSQLDTKIIGAIDGIQLETFIYTGGFDTNMIYFEIPTGMSVPLGGSKILRISQIRNAAYEFGGTYDILLDIIEAQVIIHEYTYKGVASPTVAPFSSISQILSSHFSGDVFTTYTMSVNPTYKVPVGGTITIDFPAYASGHATHSGLNYDHLPNSVPPATLELNPSGYFSTNIISASKISITVSKEITENTPIVINMKGAKNPTFEGSSLPGDFKMTIKNAGGQKINEGNFGIKKFFSKKKIDVLYMTITSTSYYKSVASDYTFAVQTSNTLPLKGFIYLIFPVEWAPQVTSTTPLKEIVGTFTSAKLLYDNENYNPATRTLKLRILFTWPLQKSIKLLMNNIINPTFSQTATFIAYTEYDGVKLDETDPLDVALRLSFLDLPPAITVNSFDIFPKNEGEISTNVLNLKSPNKLPVGSQIEIAYPGNFDSILSTYDKGIDCSSPSMPNLVCTVSNGKLIIPVTQEIPANTDFVLNIEGIMNPNSNTSGQLEIITREGSQVTSYKSSAASYATQPAPKNLAMTTLSTTSTNLQAKADYSFCIQTADPISLTTEVFIEFPGQFSLRSNSYACQTDTGHDAVKYSDTPTSPKCEIKKKLRRIVITGHTTAFAGGSTKSLCYKILKIENPAISGESGNFIVSLYDSATKLVTAKTYGTLSYPTTLSYKREGLRIIVDSIAAFATGIMSNFISVQLEKRVPYDVKCTPTAPGFTFNPSVLTFQPSGTGIEKFRIVPLDSTPPGEYKITWAKTETTTTQRFSEVADSYFTLLKTPNYKSLKIDVGVGVSRAALGATSLPITVKLSSPAASNLTFKYWTVKPPQSDYVQFNPSPLVFQPGQTELTFTYTTKIGGVSGSINFGVETPYDSKYVLSTTSMNFEILDIDKEKPRLINYYIVDLDRTYLYFRISSSESVHVYYLLTLKGTIPPPIDEIKDPKLRVSRKTKTDVFETSGTNYSYPTTITKTYIYYDAYLSFKGLEEQTHYQLFFFIEDLSGNAGNLVSFPFRTFRKYQPARFNLVLKDNANVPEILSAFGIITGLKPERFIVNSAPKKFNITTIEAKVKNILKLGIVQLEFTIITNKTANEIRPIAQVDLLENNKETLLAELPVLQSTYNINSESHEVVYFPQEFTFKPRILSIKTETVSFEVSLKKNGTLFGIVMEKGSPVPTPRQMKYSHNSINFFLKKQHYVSAAFEYSAGSQNTVIQTVEFSALYDNTEYEAYFIAENKLPGNPDLLGENEIRKVVFKTNRATFKIPDDYVYGLKLAPKAILTVISLFIIIGALI